MCTCVSTHAHNSHAPVCMHTRLHVRACECVCACGCAPGGVPCSSPSRSRASRASWVWCRDRAVRRVVPRPAPTRVGWERPTSGRDCRSGRQPGAPPAPGGPRHSAPPAKEGRANTDSGPGVHLAMERGTQHPERTQSLLPTSVRPFRPGAAPRRLHSAPPLPWADAAAALGLAVAQLCTGPF